MADYSKPPSAAKLHLEPFEVAVPQQQLDEMQQLIQLSPLGPETYENSLEDQSLGVSWKFMSEAKQAWQTSYNWRECESRINSFPNFTAQVVDPEHADEVHNIHFVALFSAKADAVPIVFLHGWPGSILEFLPLLDLLKKKYPDPAQLPYHVIVPSLIGYAFSSSPPKHRHFETHEIARIINALLEGLGFAETGYIAQGGDVGSFVSRDLAARHKACKAIHLNFIVVNQTPPGLDDSTLSTAERKALERAQDFMNLGTAYAHEHSTRPATIGFALSASPLALLAWIGEKFVAWTDVTPSISEILDSVTLYWLTQTFARAIYPYRSNNRQPRDLVSRDSIYHIADKPIGYSRFPFELKPTPVAWAKETGNLVWSRQHEAGGHFAALERPGELLQDVEDYVAQVWPVGQTA